jgi:RND family efflux transporter MFP subunit
MATLVEAQDYLAALKGEEIPEDATGENLVALDNARSAIQSAEDELNGTRLITPISGTIISLDFVVGDTVSENSEIITIADLSQKNIEIYLDETDWDKIAVGYEAEVTFDAMPDQVFTGSVIQVDPSLYTSNNTSVVHGSVALDSTQTEINLPVGSSAAVDVIAGRAENALLVPIEALRKAGDQYAVFVMDNGTPKLHVVEVGIQDILYAEIKSGLNVGDVVTTGIVETQ